MASSEIVRARESASAGASSQPVDPAREALEQAGVLARLDELQRITEELFPGEVSHSIETDPELPDVHYVVFDVWMRKDYAETSRLRHEWYQRTYELLGDDCDKVCLFVGAKP